LDGEKAGPMFWNSDQRHRRNHIKLVFQNVLAGQEMLTMSLAIYNDDQVAKNANEATQRLLAFSRKLMAALCSGGTKLSPHNAEEQLKVNRSYRKMYAATQQMLPQVNLRDFDEVFRPARGWQDFEKQFDLAPLDAVRAADLFWDQSNP
jgi:hypothetical protein